MFSSRTLSGSSGLSLYSSYPIGSDSFAGDQKLVVDEVVRVELNDGFVAWDVDEQTCSTTSAR